MALYIKRPILYEERIGWGMPSVQVMHKNDVTGRTTLFLISSILQPL